MRILVVEDDPGTRKTITAFLGELDCEILEAGSTEEAMEVLGHESGQKVSNPVDLIITDYEMPGLSGQELTEIIRSRKELESTHVIMVTMHDKLDVMSEAFQKGIIDFIAKPVEKDPFLTKVREALDLIQKERAQAS